MGGTKVDASCVLPPSPNKHNGADCGVHVHGVRFGSPNHSNQSCHHISPLLIVKFKSMNIEILECNKLIAKFMGYSKIEDTSNLTCDTKELWIENKNAEPNKRILQGLPDYHSSWDWLMPVVEKIESFSAGLYHSFSVKIQDNYCGILCHEQNRQSGIIYQTPYGTNPESKIVATWDAVVEFIKWHNLNQPTH